jgi:hypothetical protein
MKIQMVRAIAKAKGVNSARMSKGAIIRTIKYRSAYWRRRH